MDFFIHNSQKFGFHKSSINEFYRLLLVRIKKDFQLQAFQTVNPFDETPNITYNWLLKINASISINPNFLLVS
jgi:hypothetical protein